MAAELPPFSDYPSPPAPSSGTGGGPTSNRLLAQALRAKYEAEVVKGIAMTACLLNTQLPSALQDIDDALESMATAHVKYQLFMQHFGALLAMPNATTPNALTPAAASAAPAATAATAAPAATAAMAPNAKDVKKTSKK